MNNENKRSENKTKIIIIGLCAIVGIALLIFGGYSDKDSGSEGDGDAIARELASLDAQKYAEELEGKIESLCEGVSGVGKVRAYVTLSGGYSAVYAQNSQSGASGYRNEFVLTGSGSSESALLVGYSAPQIAGVGIVCVGGMGARSELVSLVSAAFGVCSNKIYVTEGKS